MSSESDGDDEGKRNEAKKRRYQGDDGQSDSDYIYKPFLKPGYRRSYPDNSLNDEFPVYIEGISREDKIGNKNPLLLSKIFKSVKGIKENRRINANKIMLIFKQAVAANDFINHNCLKENNMKAYIPASSVERVGKIRFIPTETSNTELFDKLISDSEIIAVRRFTKKVGGNIVPMSIISVTFSSTVLPDFVYLDNWRYKVFQYVPPLMQCFRCLKFRHSAKVCRNEQVCSKCSGNHSYKDCSSEILKCCNCQGDHLAISRFCPVKQALYEKHKNVYLAKQYATVVSKEFPPLQRLQNRPDHSIQKNQIKSQALIDNPNSVKKQPTKLNSTNNVSYENLLNDNQFLEIIVKTIVMIANSNSAKTMTHIKDILKQNLTL